MKTNRFLTLCWLTALTAGLLVAGPIYPLGEQDPVGFSTNTVLNATRGWLFLVNEAGLVVTQLGANTPASGDYPVTVTLFDATSQAVLAQVVTTPGAGWVWETLGSPVPLSQGSQYIVAMWTGTGDGARYYYGDALPASWYPTGAIEYITMRFDNHVEPSDFPTLSLSGYQYGIPDIGYEMSGVPEPLTAALTGIGLCILCAARVSQRRRRTPPRE